MTIIFKSHFNNSEQSQPNLKRSLKPTLEYIVGEGGYLQTFICWCGTS